MSKLFAALVVTLLGGTALLYIEYCWFDTENCPVHAASLTDSTSQPLIKTATLTDTKASLDCPKTRGVNEQLVEDCEPRASLRFKINYLYRHQGQGDFYTFGEGSVLHSGDSLKLLFKPTEEAYVSIFMVDSHGNIARLFPTADFRGASQANRNPVQKNREYFVPAPHKSFRLDHNTGEESLYFIATRKPDAVLEQQYHKLSVAQQTQAIETLTIIQEQLIVEFKKNEKQRLIEPELATDIASTEQPTSFEEAGQRFSILPSYLNNLCEGCVYRVTFKHF